MEVKNKLQGAKNALKRSLTCQSQIISSISVLRLAGFLAEPPGM